MLLVAAEGAAHRVAAEPEPPADGGEAVALPAQLQDLRQPSGGWLGRLASNTLTLQEPSHLLAADARRAGNAAGAVALAVEVPPKGRHAAESSVVGLCQGQ